MRDPLMELRRRVYRRSITKDIGVIEALSDGGDFLGLPFVLVLAGAFGEPGMARFDPARKHNRPQYL
jgi:hypothetical protein